MENNKREILETAKEYINSLKEGIKKSVNYYQTGEERNGSELVIQIADGMEWLIQALTMTHDEIHVEKDIKVLNEKLNEIIEAFENEDYVLIGDLLEYEVIPVLDSIQSSI